jgi:tetratricopeptide (TPR) repeat protein
MCFYNIAKGQLKDAIYACQTCEQQFKHEPDSEQSGLKGLCQLLRVSIDFNKGNYKECLNQLRQLIKGNPKAPSDIWFALGLCYYRTHNLPKARLSFEKTLELDGKNAMALASLGIVEIVSAPTNFESRKRAFNYFIKAFEAHPQNPLVLKYLAEHLFFKGEFALCKELCGKAMTLLESKVRPD